MVIITDLQLPCADDEVLSSGNIYRSFLE